MGSLVISRGLKIITCNSGRTGKLLQMLLPMERMVLSSNSSVKTCSPLPLSQQQKQKLLSKSRLPLEPNPPLRLAFQRSVSDLKLRLPFQRSRSQLRLPFQRSSSQLRLPFQRSSSQLRSLSKREDSKRRKNLLPQLQLSQLPQLPPKLPLSPELLMPLLEVLIWVMLNTSLPFQRSRNWQENQTKSRQPNPAYWPSVF